jgi:hypothetical protein
MINIIPIEVINRISDWSGNDRKLHRFDFTISSKIRYYLNTINSDTRLKAIMLDEDTLTQNEFAVSNVISAGNAD